jgi:hypothetical protein
MARTSHDWEDLPEVTELQMFDQNTAYYDGLCGGKNAYYVITQWDEVWDIEIPEKERFYHNAERVYLLIDNKGKLCWILERNTDHNFFKNNA